MLVIHRNFKVNPLYKDNSMFKKMFSKKERNEKKGVLEFKDGSKLDPDIFWLRRELEFQKQNEKFQFRTNENHSLKFGKIVNSLFDIRKEELFVLTINDGNLKVIEGEDKIWNYEFLNHYKRNEKGEYSYFREGCSKLINQIVLTLSYRTYEKHRTDKDKSISKKDAMLIIHMQPNGTKDQVVYIQTTFCKPVIMLERDKKGVNPQPEYLSILIAYDYRPDDEITKELFSVFNSAKNKVDNNRIDELDCLEEDLLSIINHPDIAREFYSGKRAMRENRFWDAIVFFDNSFKSLQQKWWKETLSSEELQTLIECSFLIGYCYYEIGLFDKSYKYLKFSANTVGRYKYQAEYINCLIALHDISSLSEIDLHLKRLDKKAEKEKDELDYRFLMFLMRRKAYCLIELELYEEAEVLLGNILSNDSENQFAKQEIEYIKEIKRKEFKSRRERLVGYDAKLYKGGTKEDTIPDGYGEFGHEVTNPIPVYTIIGNRVYLEKLRTLEDKKVQYKRIRSTSVPNIDNAIDIYEIYDDGKVIATLYISPYNKKDSGRPPKGFKLVAVP